MNGWMDGWMDGMGFLMKERNGRSEDRDGDKGWGYADFCFEVVSGLDEME